MGEASFLFVPGNRPDRFFKAWNSGADAVILDLEDAVPAERKPSAREAVTGWLAYERPVYVRVNGVRTEWFGADLAAVARSGLRGIVLPKAETATQVEMVKRVLPEGACVVPLVETALGVWSVREIAEAPGVERLAFGGSISSSTRGSRGRERSFSMPVPGWSWLHGWRGFDHPWTV